MSHEVRGQKLFAEQRIATWKGVVISGSESFHKVLSYHTIEYVLHEDQTCRLENPTGKVGGRGGKPQIRELPCQQHTRRYCS